MLPMPSVDWQDSGVKKVLALMAPAIFGVSVSQINLLLDTVLATFLPTGSVSWLYYSDRLSELPLGVFGIAIATVILPNLSRHHVAQSTQAFSQTLDWALKMILLIAVPAAVALILLAEPILVTLFYYGEVMTVRDMAMASLSLKAYAAGLIAFMLIKVLAPGFFARQDMRTPVRIGVIAMVMNMLFNLVLVIPLHSYWQIGHLGLAAATSLSAFLNAILLYFALRNQGIYQPVNGWLRFFIRLAIAVLVMLLILIQLSNVLGGLESFYSFNWIQRVAYLGLLCGAGFVGFAISLLLLGFRWSELQGPAKATSNHD
jgi:putative peptidoglycan lipid II flippase